MIHLLQGRLRLIFARGYAGHWFCFDDCDNPCQERRKAVCRFAIRSDDRPDGWAVVIWSRFYIMWKPHAPAPVPPTAMHPRGAAPPIPRQPMMPPWRSK